MPSTEDVWKCILPTLFKFSCFPYDRGDLALNVTFGQLGLKCTVHPDQCTILGTSGHLPLPHSSPIFRYPGRSSLSYLPSEGEGGAASGKARNVCYITILLLLFYSF